MEYDGGENGGGLGIVEGMDEGVTFKKSCSNIFSR